MLFQGVEMLMLCEADRDAAMTARGRGDVAEDEEVLRLIAATNGLSEAAADALVRRSVEAGRAAYRSSTSKKPGCSAIAILSPHQGQCISSAPQRRGVSRGPVVHSFAVKATGRIEVLDNRFMSPITRGLCHRLHVQSVTDYLWTTAGIHPSCPPSPIARDRLVVSQGCTCGSTDYTWIGIALPDRSGGPSPIARSSMPLR